MSVRSSQAPISVKIVVSGGFGVGKTTFVGAISEIEPLVTEAEMTKASGNKGGPDGGRRLNFRRTGR